MQREVAKLQRTVISNGREEIQLRTEITRCKVGRGEPRGSTGVKACSGSLGTSAITAHVADSGYSTNQLLPGLVGPQYNRRREIDLLLHQVVSLYRPLL